MSKEKLSQEKLSQAKALALGSNWCKTWCDCTHRYKSIQLRQANSPSPRLCCNVKGKLISWLNPGSHSELTAKPGAESWFLTIPLSCSPPRLVLYCLWEPTSRQATNYADREAFKNMLLIIQVPGQKPHTFTCGKNDSSFSWGPLPSSFLYFYFLVFLSFLRKRTGCLNAIKANYFSQNICLQA